MTNVLVVAQRRKRLKEAEAAGLIDLYQKLPIHTDDWLELEPVYQIRALALQHSISAYDAAYLELAQRRRLSLATLDKRLAEVARETGIKVV